MCVAATIVDEKGTLHPWADNMVTFDVKGPGKIIAVDNANPASHESFRGTERRAFEGRCIAIIAATADTGQITVTAFSPDLKPDSVTIEAVAMDKK